MGSHWQAYSWFQEKFKIHFQTFVEQNKKRLMEAHSGCMHEGRWRIGDDFEYNLYIKVGER